MARTEEAEPPAGTELRKDENGAPLRLSLAPGGGPSAATAASAGAVVAVLKSCFGSWLLFW